jgi:uncharacterized protein YqeY
MTLRERLMADVKAAMKNKDQIKMDAIRFLQSAIKNREIELRPETITDAEILAVIKKMAKQRKESIEQYEKADRQDLVKKEQTELAIIEAYLPQQLTREQIVDVVQQVITALSATSVKQMGAVIKEVQARTQGAVDNKAVSEIVKSRLQQ